MPATATGPTETPRPVLPTTPTTEFFRPLFVRRVPEKVWILVHDNANRSRMRLQDYIVEILKNCEPITR